MHFYYAACVCHSVWLLLLILITTNTSWKDITRRSKQKMLTQTGLATHLLLQERFLVLYYVFEFGILVICTAIHTRCICLLVLFALNDNYSWIVIPTVLPGKVKRMDI